MPTWAKIAFGIGGALVLLAVIGAVFGDDSDSGKSGESRPQPSKSAVTAATPSSAQEPSSDPTTKEPAADPTTSEPSPVRTPADAAASLTAKQATEKLAAATGVTTLGHPTDNTSGCASDDDNGCEQLITTDTVSVYEFKTAAVSAHWVKTMKANGDWRQVGRFALAWTARDQGLTSDERRDDLTSAMKDMVSNG
jgi:hypothetical protein